MKNQKFRIEIAFFDPVYGTEDRKILIVRSVSPSLLEFIESAEHKRVNIQNILPLLDCPSSKVESLSRWIECHPTSQKFKVRLLMTDQKKQNQYRTKGSIYMLQILAMHQCFDESHTMSSREIVEHLSRYDLEVNNRAPQYYKSAINGEPVLNLLSKEEKADYQKHKKEYEKNHLVLSKKGPNGGFWLNSNILLPTLNFTDQEKEALIEAYSFLQTAEGIKNPVVLETAFLKILNQCSLKFQNLNHRSQIYYFVPYHVRWNELEKYLETIQSAIRSNHWISFSYQKRESIQKEEKTIRPHKIIFYDGNFYIVGTENKGGSYKKYRVDPFRMYDLQELDSKFLYDDDFKTSRELGCFGLYHQDEMICKIAIKKNFLPVFQGMNIGLPINENGDIATLWMPIQSESDRYRELLDEDWLIFRFKRDNKQVFINSLFEMRDNALLLEPEELVEEVEEIIENIKNNYKSLKKA